MMRISFEDFFKLQGLDSLSAFDRREIDYWFLAIAEDDPDARAEMVENCRRNPAARKFILMEARAARRWCDAHGGGSDAFTRLQKMLQTGGYR